MDRTSKLALASLIFNIAFAVYHLVLGLVTGSWWLLTLGSAVCIIVFLLGLNLVRGRKILFKNIKL